MNIFLSIFPVLGHPPSEAEDEKSSSLFICAPSYPSVVRCCPFTFAPPVPVWRANFLIWQPPVVAGGTKKRTSGRLTTRHLDVRDDRNVLVVYRVTTAGNSVHQSAQEPSSWFRSIQKVHPQTTVKSLHLNFMNAVQQISSTEKKITPGNHPPSSTRNQSL